MNPLLLTLFVAVIFVPFTASAEETISEAELEFFENRIRPVLVNNCYVCHSAEASTRMGGLSLDTREGIRAGGQRGHAVMPNDVESSVLLEALRYDGKLKMPPSGRLPEEIIQDFTRWVEIGAPDPRDPKATMVASSIDLSKGRQHWAFKAPVKAPLPGVQDGSWLRGSIDQYVLSELESQGLRPVQDASRADLLRRVTIDLTGLPPTLQEIEHFLLDDSEPAYRKVVDRLLESERFGERWGRHWLDLARYADSTGRTRNVPFPVAWKYRDYVINSFNKDKPYDRFLMEQLAGDLLPFSNSVDRNEKLVATGFLAQGAYDLNEPDAKQFAMDVVDEMINVTSRTILALGVGCARCHDHKFDPIPTIDYYALAGIFRSTDVCNGVRRRPKPGNSGYFRIQRLVELEGVPEYTTGNIVEIRSERSRVWEALQAAMSRKKGTKIRDLARELGKLPLPENLAMGVLESADPMDAKVNIGGDPHTLGQSVPRGFLQVVFPEDAEVPSIARGESGRLQLAQWLTRRDNPLTSRVMANRIWTHLFGNGIVSSVDNFGSSGSKPTQPLLLDYLAVQFMDQKWSVQNLIRDIVLSRTHGLSTGFDQDNFQIDPDNKYFWRANLRRVEVEVLRDSILLVSGELRVGAPEGSPMHGFDRSKLLKPGSKQIKPWELEESYRSVYLPVIRNASNRLYDVFDFPDASETRGSRDVTTTPTQALFLMNSEFVQSQARIAAERLLTSEQTDPERIRQTFLQTLGRDPSAKEIEQTLRRVDEILAGVGKEQSATQEVWLHLYHALFNSAEFRYLN